MYLSASSENLLDAFVPLWSPLIYYVSWCECLAIVSFPCMLCRWMQVVSGTAGVRLSLTHPATTLLIYVYVHFQIFVLQVLYGYFPHRCSSWRYIMHFYLYSVLLLHAPPLFLSPTCPALYIVILFNTYNVITLNNTNRNEEINR